jgi:hypothetical protein
MTEIINVGRTLSDRKVTALARELGKSPLDGRHFDRVLGAGDWDVHADRGWPPVLIVRRRALPLHLPASPLRHALRRAARTSDRLGGRRSGVVGSFNGRACAFNTDRPKEYGLVQWVVRALNTVYLEKAPPWFYQDQWAFARLTHPGLLIPETVFTTATVNFNEAWHMHRHRGNLTFGFSVMGVLRRGAYEGGLFVLPQYRLAVDVGNRDVVMFPPRAWHGNTAIVGDGEFERLSVVGYYRRDMIGYEVPADEYERACRAAWAARELS